MFIVCIDHLSESQLNFFGWDLVQETDEFWLYLHVRTGEEQIVDGKGKKYLLVDDVNDANAMAVDTVIIAPGAPKLN